MPTWWQTGTYWPQWDNELNAAAVVSFSKRTVWANASSRVSMHAVVESGFGLHVRTGNYWVVHAKPPCKEKTTQIAKQPMFILHVLLFSQLWQLHMHIHRTNINIVYCCYDYVSCKQRDFYLSSVGFNFEMLLSRMVIWTTPAPSHQLVWTSLVWHSYSIARLTLWSTTEKFDVVQLITKKQKTNKLNLGQRKLGM